MRTLTFLLLTAATWAQPNCPVHGTVTDESTGKPVAAAKLLLIPQAVRPLPSLLTSSNPQGDFCFQQVDAGNYVLRAQRIGYLNHTYGQGLILDVQPGVELAPLAIKLTRRAILSGTAMDGDGEPVANAEVRVFRSLRAPDGSDPDEVDNQETDDRGTFRFADLKPGTYYLGVRGRNEADRDYNVPFLDADGKPRQEAYVENLSSTPIVLQAGKDVTGVLLTTRKVQLRHISGKVTGVPDPHFVLLENNGNSSAVPVNPDGSFFRGGLEPGPVTVELRVGRQSRGKKEVDLTGGDADGVVITPDDTPVTHLNIPLQFLSEGSGPQYHPPAGGFTFLQRSDGEGGSGAQTNADGTLQFSNVVPGMYNLLVLWGDDDFYVKRILLGGRPVDGRKLDLRHGNPGAMQVVVASKSASITGQVKHDAVLSQAVTVLVVGEGTGIEERAVADQNGHFQLERVAPGKCRLFAVEGFHERGWSSEVATKLEAKSLAIELADGEKKQVELVLISAAEVSAVR